MRKSIFFILSAIAGLIIINCSSTKGPAYGEDIEPSLSVGEAIFPHKSLWGDPENHGKAVRADGTTDTAPCAGSCHGENLEGGIGPSCKSCHDDYPHESGWSLKDKHGAFVLQNGEARCATKCHGADLSGGLAEVACNRCHTVWPDEHKKEEWSENKHGSDFMALGQNACSNCHDENFCSTCHKSLPLHYKEGWGESHGEYGDINECKKCHGENLTGDPETGTPSCENCHIKVPHSENWDHGLSSIKQIDECKKCHGEELEGEGKAASCYSCHKTYPSLHHTSDWKEGAGHGEYSKEECKICHGSDFTGGVSGKTCYACHSKYPHSSEWKDAEHGGHLKSLGGDLFAQIDENCLNCHATKDCADCHSTFPDKHKDAGWEGDGDSSHGKHVLASDTSECEKCHWKDSGGENFTWSCYSCHEEYPHPADWDHGAEVLQKGVKPKSPYDKFDVKAFTQKCEPCHGAAVAADAGAEKLNNNYPSVAGFMPSGVKRCYNETCHVVYPHVYYQDYSPMYEDLQILISQTWGPQIGHKNYIIFNEGYCAKTLSEPQCNKSVAEMVEILQSSSGKGCFGQTDKVCHNNNRLGGVHTFGKTEQFCKQACHIY